MTTELLNLKWRVYYSNGSVISSEDCSPFELTPRVGVQVILQEKPDIGWVALSGYDYFMWDDRGGGPKWFRGDEAGFFQYITQPGEKCVLLGEWVDDEVYGEILREANKDREFFNKKTGWSPHERKHELD
jgi:hypothetical protein